jgi:glutamate decarboxylase
MHLISLNVHLLITKDLIILQNRCVNMIAHLFNAPFGETETAVGVGTVGSSEAIMLAGLAFKRKWQARRKLEGKPYDKPNIVTGANVQVGFTFWFY